MEVVRGDPVTTLSIDPGANIGWALFSVAGEEMARGVMDFIEFSHSLHYKPTIDPEVLFFTVRGTSLPRSVYPVTKLIYESFFLDPGVPQGGSTGPTQEVIGVLKYLCLQSGIEVYEQRSAILPVAMKHCGYEPPVTRNGNKKHLPDDDSAWLHGMEHFISKGIIRPPNDVSATL